MSANDMVRIDPLNEQQTVTPGDGVARVHAMSADGVFTSYIVHDPTEPGAYLYIGSDEAKAQQVADHFNAER
jgi:hypothetical protein